ESGGCGTPRPPYPPKWRTVMSRTAHAHRIETDDVAARVAALDWERIAADLDAYGCATTGALLTADECTEVSSRYAADSPYRSRVIMARHGFGRGEYKYFAYPLPGMVASLRESLYAPLAAIANRWNEQMCVAQHFPATHAAYLKRCHAAGQTRPTP